MTSNNRNSMGISGMDEILNGGLISNRVYLIRGGPGTGKTTLGLHFLLEGIKNDEDVLFVTFIEPAEKIKQNAENFGFDLDKVNFLDLNPDADFFQEGKDYDILASDQVEQKPLLEKISRAIEKIEPDRIFFDGITQLKYLATDKFKFRKQFLSLMQFTMKFNSTMVLTSEASDSNPDDDLQFLVDGVINLKLEESSLHTISVSKMRGTSIKKGKHSMKFTDKGIEVFTNLEGNYIKKRVSQEKLSSGIPEIDKMLFGGLERGTSTIITGPTGAGKTTLGAQFITNNSQTGQSILYTFEEPEESLKERLSNINIPVKDMVDKKELFIKEINPINYTLNEFLQLVRRDIEENDISLLMLDSITGFYMLLEDEKFSNTNKLLYNLLQYLKSYNISVILINEVKDITGDFRVTDNKSSYLSDNIIFLRHLELNGELQKAIGILKKRMSDFENRLRQFEITGSGIKVGEPLEGLRGILSGNPELIN
ncbi:AAA family ATPase [Halanaerobiaceae bacterium Z-7014]|uniref:non-specific serine/threonine protein kinase n=1 Tax=Halonatronomonas betaini TaxID=2778430 RepID=A0A931AW34_9FIRM|nr:ATPase domain-containing protein [Halonatronomonas betaini]MBF8435863.1 AAA family ATPase [Halonatronomonas betaini]